MYVNTYICEFLLQGIFQVAPPLEFRWFHGSQAPKRSYIALLAYHLETGAGPG